MKKPDPKERQIIAPTNKIDAIGYGIPLDDIYVTVFAKFVIFPGIAEIKIDDIATLAIKSKKIFIFLSFLSIFLLVTFYG